MSSGQSLRNGNSVEPGLPNTFLMPNARSRPKVASLTVSEVPVVLAGLRDDIMRLPALLHTPSLRGALATKQSILPFARIDGLLRGACHRAALRADPLARNDGWVSPRRVPLHRRLARGIRGP